MGEVQEPGLLETLGNGVLIEQYEDPFKVVMEFDAELRFCHSGGIVQGGFVTAWLDSAMSKAVILATGHERSPSSLEIKVSFIKAAKPGKVRAVGWVKHLGGKIAFLEGELFNAGGELLATSSTTAKMVNIEHIARKQNES